MAQTFMQEIVEAIAERKGIEPTELNLVLADHIDVDALCQLTDHESNTWMLSFELPEHTVTVTSEGAILVDGHQESSLDNARADVSR